MNDDPSPAERRRIVLHPRTAAARRFDRSQVSSSHVRGHTVDTDEVLNLVRLQNRTSLRHLAVLLTPLLGFMLLVAFVPAIRSARPFGLPPLSWLIVGPVALFSTAAMAFFHERRAVRIETEWSAAHREVGP